MISQSASFRPRSTRACLIGVAAIGLFAVLPSVAAANHEKKTLKVDVMTRNIFLGADLGPALDADNPDEFIEANGEIFREVTQTDFPRRAHILAEEIEDAQPDIVGLQEVALWREGPPDIAPALNNEPVATQVRYDFLNLLLDALNQGKYDEYGEGYEEGSYEPVVVQEEFDFEAPANENEVDGDGPNAFIPNAEINGRLTMRDVILVRVGSGIKVQNANGRALREPARGHRRRRRHGGRHARMDAARRDREEEGQEGQAQGQVDQEEVPLRELPLRGVRRRDPDAEHPRPAGAGAAGRSRGR